MKHTLYNKHFHYYIAIYYSLIVLYSYICSYVCSYCIIYVQFDYYKNKFIKREWELITTAVTNHFAQLTYLAIMDRKLSGYDRMIMIANSKNSFEMKYSSYLTSIHLVCLLHSLSMPYIRMYVSPIYQNLSQYFITSFLQQHSYLAYVASQSFKQIMDLRILRFQYFRLVHVLFTSPFFFFKITVYFSCPVMD